MLALLNLNRRTRDITVELIRERFEFVENWMRNKSSFRINGDIMRTQSVEDKLRYMDKMLPKNVWSPHKERRMLKALKFKINFLMSCRDKRR